MYMENNCYLLQKSHEAHAQSLWVTASVTAVRNECNLRY